MNRRALIAILAGALVASAVSSAHAEPDPSGDFAFAADGAGLAPVVTARGGPPVVARTGNLTFRPSGMPTSPAPARRLKSATVKQNLTAGRLTGTFELRAVPDSATKSDLRVLFGYLNDGSCDADVEAVTPTAGSLAAGFSRSGSTFTLNTTAISEASYRDWDCAFAALTASGQPPSAATTHDMLIGELNDVYGKPRLVIKKVELLRSKVRKKLKLVRNVWTKVDVTVKNSGTADAPRAQVGGGGKGLRIGAAKLGKVPAGATRSGEVKVKLTSGRKRRLRLVARSGRVTGGRKIAVVAVPPPPRPASGTYRNDDGRVNFRIRNGKVVGWRGYMQTRCGGYPGLPTYTWNTYDFPTKKVERNGIVDARDRGDLYTAGLMLKAAGKRVTKGYFYYSGPNRCFASTTFTAKRTGG